MCAYNVINTSMKVEKLIIVGGGTSAWLTAAYLYKNQPDIQITVVDKELGTPIGVGEATLLTFKSFMEECGFDFDDWFVNLDGGYKSGIVFSNWREPGDDIWHPFWKGNRIINSDFRLWEIWSVVQDHFDFKTYATGMHDSSIDHNTVDYLNIDSYASHIDAGKLVLFIKEKLKNKINFINSDVVDIIRKENNNIDHLVLKNETVVTADLYVDCTGFNSILRNNVERIDLAGRLFVNTAVVCPVPYNDRTTEFKCYADCEAVDHGWIWKIGTSSRIGSGMVFNRDITDIDEAKKYFVNHWDDRIKVEDVRAINWDPFYIKNPWSGNTVCIGLSNGFIEPLESTGIGLITIGITQLNNILQHRWFDDGSTQQFNIFMSTLFENCIDFVSMHYANNKRNSDFWSWVTKTFQPSSIMKHYVDELANPNIRVPFKGRFDHMFGGGNWTMVLAQLGFSIGRRNISIPEDVALNKIASMYIENEKNRHIWSRPHALEVDRIRELYKL